LIKATKEALEDEHKIFPIQMSTELLRQSDTIIEKRRLVDKTKLHWKNCTKDL